VLINFRLLLIKLKIVQQAPRYFATVIDIFSKMRTLPECFCDDVRRCRGAISGSPTFTFLNSIKEHCQNKSSLTTYLQLQYGVVKCAAYCLVLTDLDICGINLDELLCNGRLTLFYSGIFISTTLLTCRQVDLYSSSQYSMCKHTKTIQWLVTQ